MSIVSIGFFALVAVTLAVYYVMPLKARPYVLLVSGFAYIAIGSGIECILIVVLMSMLAYGCTVYTAKFPDKKDYTVKTVIILFAVMLILMKDSSFFTDNINHIARWATGETPLPTGVLVTSLGVSYFTLMLIGYILDVSWGKTEPEKNPFKLMLFTSFFPQMMSGPISRYDDIRKTLFSGNRFDYDGFFFGLQRFIWGLFKTLVISERLSVIVSAVYGNYTEINGIFCFIAAICYMLQIYTNFSGSMDIVIGIAQMFGVTLPENFRQPLFSQSLSEVWRRWHITLGFWVKDYVLYPVLKSGFVMKIRESTKRRFGKKASKAIPTYFGMFVTWFIVGFWHGGSWKFIFSSGLFFFFLITGGMIFQPLFDKLKAAMKINEESRGWKRFSNLRTVGLFTMSISFGRAKDMYDGFAFWKAGFTGLVTSPINVMDQFLQSGIEYIDIAIIVTGLLIFLYISQQQQKSGILERLSKRPLPVRWTLHLALLFSVVILGCYGPEYNPASFIYGGF